MIVLEVDLVVKDPRARFHVSVFEDAGARSLVVKELTVSRIH